MIGRIFAFVMIGALAILSVQEIVRFNRAARDREGLPYPRRRLIRRLTVASLFVATLILVAFWPDAAGVRVRLGLTAFLFGLLAVAFVLLFRDLSETSRAVVALASEMDRRTTRELERLIAESKAKGEENQISPDELK